MSLTSTWQRRAASIAALALLAVPLAACGSDDDSSSDGPPKAVAVIETLSGRTTAIKLDGGFVDALGSLGLTPGVTGTAKLTDSGSLVFPITGGNVSVFTPGEVSPYVIGQIQHEGSGLTLSAGGTTVRLSNFNVDPGVSRVYGDVAVNGKTVATSAFLFQLDGRTLMPLSVEGNTAVLEGTKVEISEVAAPLLNDTFKTKAVKPGLLVGIAKITVNVK
ncbi:MAG: hypothetical protein F2667_09205 [Actinobacteria bacterium]|uniref:Unannotated protein n=1 Tax=freshwater metagenome TaxID=449393 RepID=A0A6J6QZK9_9ZZZZ|nr:hypothetical protein [Actinomycetota bacterium]